MINRLASFTDSPEEFARLRDDLMAFYRPASSQERLVVERIAFAQQSILRAARLEISLFADPPEGSLVKLLEMPAFTIFLRYQAQAQRAYHRAIEELMSLMDQRPLPPPVPQPAPSAFKPQPVPTPAATPSSPPRSPAASPAAGAPVPAPVSSAARCAASTLSNPALRL
jgi:hypothetical protein